MEFEDMINNVVLGDCYEVIKNIPDKSIDLVIIDPPYQFCAGGNGSSDIAKRKYNQKKQMYSLDTDLTKRKIGTGYSSGGGCFETKKRNYHSQINLTDVNIDNKADKNSYFISKGFTNQILDELVRVIKKINIYIWCSKAQLRQIIDYFDDLGCNIDLLTWHKTNPIPTCNNTYLSDTEYCIFARESGVSLYGTTETKKKYYVTSCNVFDKDKFEHPTIKPVNILSNFIINSSKENDVVLDTFAGSGSTLVSAKNLNRRYIGIELNPKWHKVAVDRLNNIDANGQMSLFTM